MESRKAGPGPRPDNAVLAQTVQAVLSSRSRNACLVFADGTALNGGDLLGAVGRTASALLSHGVAPGDRVLIQAEKSAHVLPIFLAALEIGAVLVPLSVEFSRAGVETVIQAVRPTVLIAASMRLSQLAPRLRMSRVRSVLAMDGDGSGTFRDLVAGQSSARIAVLVREGDLALLHYHVSSTGDLRGAMFSQAALARQARHAATLCALGPSDVMGHALEAWWEPSALAFAAAALISAVPLHWLRAHEGVTGPAHDPPTVLVHDGAAPCGHMAPAYRSLHSKRGVSGEGQQTYVTLPETGLLAGAADARRARVIAGLEADVTESRLRVTDPCLFSGYWRQARATNEALAADGSFNTGLPVARDDDSGLVLYPQP